MVVAVNVLLSPFSYIEIETKNKTFLGMALLFLVKRMLQVGFSLFVLKEVFLSISLLFLLLLFSFFPRV